MMPPRWVLATAAAIGVVAIAVSWQVLRVRNAVDVNGSVDDRSSVASILERARPQGPAGEGVRALGYANGPTVPVAAPAPDADTKKTTIGENAQAAANTQMIVRTASIALSTEKFDDMRAALERVAASVMDRSARSQWRATRRISAA